VSFPVAYDTKQQLYHIVQIMTAPEVRHVRSPETGLVYCLEKVNAIHFI